ncbi:hypothetical protein K2F54_14180 [Cryobacterium sp. 1639]|uniref:hypothetical protein n=1 Tax=Cryobacterium inferilacus TaxID=2866629 RepID=UPI001C72C482|nr:hypothetical protein [Cryobacterium sp. 1639]MBX0301119.1 hypothetical protein [Cryobacterium sp. 1639]
MPQPAEKPVVVRARAFIGPSRWLQRPVRKVRYDARWADGRVDVDVDLVAAMYRGWPADFQPIRDAVHEYCPEIGPGWWVNERGWVEGPAQPGTGPSAGSPARPQVPKRQPSPKARAIRRLVGGAVVLGVGIWLLTGVTSEGAVGWLGAICALVGLSVLAAPVWPRPSWRKK